MAGLLSYGQPMGRGLLDSTPNTSGNPTGLLGTVNPVGATGGQKSVAEGEMGGARSIHQQLRDYLVKEGWNMRHTSKNGGKVSSYYLTPPGDLNGKGEVRISNHELGYKNGERQGGRWSNDIVTDPELSFHDHVQAIKNADYGNDMSGFKGGYSFGEWQKEQGGSVGAIPAIGGGGLGGEIDQEINGITKNRVGRTPLG